MKKLFTLLTMLVIGISGMWGDNNPVVVTFGNSTPIVGLTTDAFNFNDTTNPSGELSDGTTYSFTTTNGELKFWAGNDGKIQGTWENTYAIEDINNTLGTSTSFTAALFSANSPLKYLATGNGGSKSTLTLTFAEKNEGDYITLYASLARRNASLDNFSADGLSGMKVQFARRGHNEGFQDTQQFSQLSGSEYSSPITIVKITGWLTSAKSLTMSSTSDKNGWQMIAYRFYHQVTFKCKVNGELIYTESVFAKTGDVLNVPDLPGYTASPSSFTVESTDASPEITYTASSYPVNFKREQTFTRSDRHINSVTFDIDGEDQTVNELYNNTSTKCYQDLTDSKTVTLPVNTSVKPKLYALGGWQHGFVYIDLNNDGFFNVDEELVSKINEGNPNLSTDMLSFTTPSTSGTYRMRIKTDWSSTDPGGNTGADPHEITSNNHIIKNGGMIVDVNLVISEYEVTYQVQDENENVLYTSSAVPTTLGTKITTLPAHYQKADFYDYNTLDITISDLKTTAVFTATKKTNPLVQFSSDASSAYYYNLKIRGKYMVYNSGATGEVTLQDNSEPFNPDAAWAFIGNPYAGFKVINKTKGTDYFLTYTEVTTSRPAGNNVQFLEDANFQDRYWLIESNTGGICLRMKENTNIYFHHEKNGNYLRTCSKTEWSAVHNDEGSTIVATTDEEVLLALFDNMKDMRFGTGVGEYSTTYVSQDGAASDISSIGTVIVMGLTSQYALAYTTLLDIESKSTLNQPTTGYYQIKSKFNEETGYYLSCENIDENDDTNAKQTTTTDKKNIFYIEIGNTNSTIKSYSTGYYFGKYTRANYTADTENPIKWTFIEGSNKGTYQLNSTNDGSKILYGWSGVSSKSYADRNPSADADGHTDWILIPIAKEDLPVIEAPGSTETNPVIQGKIESTDDVTDKITASATFVDLSDATIDASIDEIKAEVEKINPNAIIIAPEGTSVESTTTNVLLTTDTENTYTCNNLQFTDNVIAQFTSETNFTDTKVTYTRASSESVWGTICLPYATSTEGDVSYYRLAESSTSNLRFEKISESTTTPNEPYLIKKAANAGLSIGADDQDFTIGVAEPQEVSSENDYKLQGVLVNTSVIDGDNYTTAKSGYVATTDANAYYFDAASTKFCKLNGRFNLKAFRAYLTTNSGEARPNIGFDLFDDDQPTGVNIIESEDGNTVDVIFDLNGRHLQNAKKGINIINGKKVIK